MYVGDVVHHPPYGLVAKNFRSIAAGEVIVVRITVAVDDRLAELLEAAQVEPRKRAKTRINRANKAKRLEAKKKRGQVKAARGKVEW